MKAFKFVVGPTFVTLPSDPSYQVANCAAVVFAHDRESAMALLRADLLAHGDVLWCEVATVIEVYRDGLPPTVAIVVQG